MRLPTPDERQASDVVIYDGNCTFCRRQVERLAVLDSRGHLAFLSLHEPDIANRYPDLTHQQLMQEMYVVDRSGNRHRGAGAFRFLTRRLRKLWVLAPLLHIPFSLPMWQWLYRQIARRRYKLSGSACDEGTCQVHLR